MNATVHAHLTLSFRGETREFDATIDLDRCVGDSTAPPDLHRILARAVGVDLDSYLYEVFESHEIHFSEPTGIARGCCPDGGFDWVRFHRQRRDAADTEVIRTIAEQTLGVSDLDAREDLKTALLAAYRAGKGEEA